MKKIQNKKSASRVIIWVVLAILVVSLAAVAVYAYNKSGPSVDQNQESSSNEDPIDYGAPSEEQVQAGKEAKRESIESDPNTSTINISSLQKSNEVLQVRTVLSSIGTSGKCTLTITSGGQAVYAAEAGIQQLGSYSVCRGFDVPVDSIPAGSLLVKVVYTDANGTESTATKEYKG